MINACVSHEMRNPLNSIIAQNIEKKEIYHELSQLTQKFRLKKIKAKQFLDEQEIFLSRLSSGWKIQ
jgi:hypothetical protein